MCIYVYIYVCGVCICGVCGMCRRGVYVYMWGLCVCAMYVVCGMYVCMSCVYVYVCGMCLWYMSLCVCACIHVKARYQPEMLLRSHTPYFTETGSLTGI